MTAKIEWERNGIKSGWSQNEAARQESSHFFGKMNCRIASPTKLIVDCARFQWISMDLNLFGTWTPSTLAIRLVSQFCAQKVYTIKLNMFLMWEIGMIVCMFGCMWIHMQVARQRITRRTTSTQQAIWQSNQTIIDTHPVCIAGCA